MAQLHQHNKKTMTFDVSYLILPAGREAVAKTLSKIINGLDQEGFPYQPNDGDNSYWTLDPGNNWKVKFYDEEPKKFEVIHRYNKTLPDFEKAAVEAFIELEFGD